MDLRQFIRNQIPDRVQRFLLRGASSFSVNLFLEDLRSSGNAVGGFLDIGAADGVITDVFIRKFGRSKAYRMIEPRSNKVAALKAKYSGLTDSMVYETLITKDARTVSFSLKGNGSSIFDIEDDDEIEQYSSSRIDVLEGLSDLQDFVVKIDVQGAELEVLEAMGAMLDNAVGFIIECNNCAAGYTGAPSASQVISFLHSRGFDLYAPGHLFRNEHHIVFQFDLMFLRRDIAEGLVSG